MLVNLSHSNAPTGRQIHSFHYSYDVTAFALQITDQAGRRILLRRDHYFKATSKSFVISDLFLRLNSEWHSLRDSHRFKKHHLQLWHCSFKLLSDGKPSCSDGGQSSPG